MYVKGPFQVNEARWKGHHSMPYAPSDPRCSSRAPPRSLAGKSRLFDIRELIHCGICDRKASLGDVSPSFGALLREVIRMTVRSFGASFAAMVLVSTLAVGCSNKAEQAANRAEDAAKRAESAAARVEAAAQRAEAAAEKVERLFSKSMHK